MQLYSRIVANLLVMSNITSKFTSETDQIRSEGGGPWGGLTPSQQPSSKAAFRTTLPSGCHGSHGPLAPKAQGPPSVWGNTLARRLAGSYYSYYSLVHPPRWPPKCSGTVRGSRRAFHRFIQTFLGDILVVVEFYSQLTACSHACFFFRNRPLEKSPHQSCRAFRGEVDSSIPRVFGGLLVVVFEARENSSVSN